MALVARLPNNNFLFRPASSLYDPLRAGDSIFAEPIRQGLNDVQAAVDAAARRTLPTTDERLLASARTRSTHSIFARMLCTVLVIPAALLLAKEALACKKAWNAQQLKIKTFRDSVLSPIRTAEKGQFNDHLLTMEALTNRADQIALERIRYADRGILQSTGALLACAGFVAALATGSSVEIKQITAIIGALSLIWRTATATIEHLQATSHTREADALLVNLEELTAQPAPFTVRVYGRDNLNRYNLTDRDIGPLEGDPAEFVGAAPPPPPPPPPPGRGFGPPPPPPPPPVHLFGGVPPPPLGGFVQPFRRGGGGSSVVPPPNHGALFAQLLGGRPQLRPANRGANPLGALRNPQGGVDVDAIRNHRPQGAFRDPLLDRVPPLEQPRTVLIVQLKKRFNRTEMGDTATVTANPTAFGLRKTDGFEHLKKRDADKAAFLATKKADEELLRQNKLGSMTAAERKAFLKKEKADRSLVSILNDHLGARRTGIEDESEEEVWDPDPISPADKPRGPMMRTSDSPAPPFGLLEDSDASSSSASD